MHCVLPNQHQFKVLISQRFSFLHLSYVTCHIWEIIIAVDSIIFFLHFKDLVWNFNKQCLLEKSSHVIEGLWCVLYFVISFQIFTADVTKMMVLYNDFWHSSETLEQTHDTALWKNIRTNSLYSTLQELRRPSLIFVSRNIICWKTVSLSVHKLVFVWMSDNFRLNTCKTHVKIYSCTCHHELIYFIQQSPLWEANSRFIRQEISCLLWQPAFKSTWIYRDAYFCTNHLLLPMQ
jgi:hypothetical protein